MDWGRGEILQGPSALPFPSTCFDPIVVETVNIFNGGAVYKVKSILQNALVCRNDDPTMYVGLYGCDGAIEVNQFDNYTAENKLLINTLCGKDVILGKAGSGNLIANYRLGVGVAVPTERFEVNGNGLITGKLGIGTNIPVEPLHVQGKTWLNGDVHIGENANPVNKLVVEGKVYAREFHVNEINNWPDYVFSKKYALTPLLEVEKYIKQHGHLSEIPSQEEIASQGLAVADLLGLQMKKIEELTLYVIELQKQQEELKKTIIKMTIK